MEGYVAPYLKEVGLIGNLPGQFQGTYVRTFVAACLHAYRLDATCRVHELI